MNARDQPDERLRRAGFDPKLAAHPEDPGVLWTLRSDSDEQAEWRALAIAQLRCLIAVTAALKGLTEPTAPAGLGGPDELTWWESGAFALIRLRAAALARVMTQGQDAERRLVHSTEEATAEIRLTGPWLDRLTLADEAIARGDPEAAVLHLRLALRERAADLAGIPLADLPPDFDARLAEDPEVSPLEAGLRLLAETAEFLAAGQPTSLGLAVPVAEIMAKPVRDLCLSLSTPLLKAARGDATQGNGG